MRAGKSLAFFFRLSTQRALHGAPVHIQTELRCYAVEQLLRAQAVLCGARLFDEVQYLRSELVGTTRPTLIRKKPRQPLTIKVGLHLVESRPRDAKSCGHLGDGLPLRTHAAKHFVAYLHQIPGIEEVIGNERVIANVLRVWIQGAALLEGSQFRVGFSCSAHVI
ncbi:hypothetical protein AWB82_04254 [Caballeronia glebae]|uniref:Uncharacterized protein n=1 Tax=Caballeronia glebae TaxID=1777143 RepID=A0A158BKJ1_9BURK|nr:hypothetical protein AWB82_04254 [Caballeronia glebae]